MESAAPYVSVLIAGAIACGGLSVGAWRRRGVPGAIALAAMLASTVVWSVTYSLELVSVDLPSKLFWCKVEYFGIVPAPAAWLIFSLQYTGNRKWLRKRFLLPLAIEGVATLLLVWTNDSHGLIWSRVEMDLEAPFPALLLTHGVWFWVHFATCYLELVVCSVLLVAAVYRSPTHYHRQLIATLIAIVAPWIGNILYVLGLNPAPWLDLTPFCVTVSSLALAWGLLRLRLLHLFVGIVPAARDAIVEGMRDGVIVLDNANLIVDANPAAQYIFDFPESGLVGQPVEQAIKSRLDCGPLYSAGSPETHAEISFGNSTVQRHYDLLVSPLVGENGTHHGRLAVFRDITERKQAEHALKHQALHDTLTDLPNRDSLSQQLHQAILTLGNENRSHALLVMDLDRFKEINDTFGHQCGDRVLLQVGDRLRGVLRGSDLIARLGGDEFAVLLYGADEEAALWVANRLLHSMERPFVIDGFRLHVAISIGIVIAPTHGADADTLLRRADVAMYLAKRASAGFAVYSIDQDPYSPERLELLGDLRFAIRDNDLTLHYQPQVEFKTGRVAQVEALVRWQHPHRGFIPPGEFIPLAEQTELMRPLTQWVLRSAMLQCREWARTGLSLPVAVNLSARSLHDSKLPSTVAYMLRRLDVDPSCLQLEITESGLMQDARRAVELLSELSDLGVRVSIDDFGTGYSSLAYLAQLPADEIKIDKSFVQRMAETANDSAIVRSTINLGHDLGLTVVAEGIEDRPTWDLLAELGCDIAQGYFLGRPMPASLLSGWLMDAPTRMADLAGKAASPQILRSL